ncbi:MAG: radical SAM protein [Deltaproteobacteria bacterium RIFOXYD12_FULL_50_9]|nr:MAG: radical SAM protein [Deltaproteobacteria bacterium RIFOXYD12_FULL_50_9]
MHYEGTIIRPPSEADSIILQVTVGCSYNRCTFCGTYKDVEFRIKDQETIEQDLDFAARYCRKLKRVFLADGDVLSLPQPKLLNLFALIKERLPWISRISLYANARSLRAKSVDDLRKLKSSGLARIYLGLESGHDATLQAIRKGADAAIMIAAGRKAREAEIFLSVTVLLGIAGSSLSQEHAKDTGKVLTAMEPNHIGVLTLMLLENTPLYELFGQGVFQLPDQMGLLAELYTMVDNIHLDRVLFHSNHASNYLPIDCRLSRDREKVLATIANAISGNVPLVPEFRRAL